MSPIFVPWDHSADLCRIPFLYDCLDQHACQILGVTPDHEIIGVIDIIAGHVDEALFLKKGFLHVVEAGDGGAGALQGF